ncbi:UNVERIFIED_CONTAM: hypothetical protein Slati_3052000 [Sesamum latifolium]|uniref:DUF4283 domain-containing protein n=1 Tax=Sesamum latifolium TaxID=2727402 RepID=A0AAW2UST9_9LAMI
MVFLQCLQVLLRLISSNIVAQHSYRLVSSFEQVFRPGNLYSPVSVPVFCCFCFCPLVLCFVGSLAAVCGFLVAERSLLLVKYFHHFSGGFGFNFRPLSIRFQQLGGPLWELQPPAPLALVGSITISVLAAMAKGKKAKLPAASAGRPKHSGHPVSVTSLGNSQGKPSSVPAPINATVAAGQQTLAPVSDATATAQASTMAAATSTGKTQTVHAVHANSGPRTEETSPGQGGVSVDNGTKKASFAGLFSTNRRVTTETKLEKFTVGNGTLTLEPTDLVNVRAKMGHCLVGYVAGKFPGLRAIRALAQLWGASFHQHDSGWLIFRFARDEDRQRVMAGGLYFVYGRPILLKIMPDCFEFKEDDISSTPVWAILPSLPLECWHPNALGKIGSRLGTPIAMDSLTMTMERVSYARILVEVDASKKLVDEVEFHPPEWGN